MSSDSPSNPRDSPPSPSRRRSSFVDMFSNRGALPSQNGNPQRRLSITTLGLSTLPSAQSSPFSAIRARAESVSSANSNSVDESPFEDDPSGPPPTGASGSPSVPQSPFARRMSFGAARVMRDSRAPNAANGRQPSVSSAASPPPSHNSTKAASTAKSREGFDFAESLRQRAERGSVSGPAVPMGGQTGPHQRSKSVAEQPKPQPPKQQKVPDAFQERILKGDFYMD